MINFNSTPLTTEKNEVLSERLKFSIAPLKIHYSEIIANTKGALHGSRAEVREIAKVRAHF